MKYQIKAYSIYEFGQRKDEQGAPHQEDAIFPTHQSATSRDRLFILCDGMGGHEAGEVASATVCDSLSHHLLDSDTTFNDGMLQQALDAAYDALDARCPDPSAPRKMGTTLTLLALHNQGATIAHIGDSRVYHIRPGRDGAHTRILFQTEDHSVVNSLVKIGEMTPEQAKTSSQKNVLTRAMQPFMEHRAPADLFHTSNIKSGDYFYLCSDGMLETMENEELCDIFSREGGNDEQKVKSLLLATRDNKDNHSALIVHILSVHGTVTPAVSETTDGNISPKKKKKNRLIWLVAILLFAILLCTLLMPRHEESSSPTSVESIQRPQL